MPKKYIILDSQVLTALMKCARFYNYTFVENRRDIRGKSNALECGSIAHNVLEYYYKAIIKGMGRASAIEQGFMAGKEYILPYQENNIFITDKDHKGLENTPRESTTKPSRVGYDYVFDTMKQYFDFWRIEHWTPIAVEEVRGKVIYSDDEMDIYYKAKYDLIEMSPQIGDINTDHKTMSMNRDTISLNNQFIGQCAILGTRRVQINKIGWQKSLPSEEKFRRGLVTYTTDRIAEWCNEVVPHYCRMLIAYDEAGYFPPNFTQCEDKFGWCMFKQVCESDRNMRAETLLREYREEKKWDIQN